MRKLKVKCKRIISILLVAAMLMGSLSPYVYAADVTGHVTGAADVMLEGDAYDLPGVEEELSTVGAEDFDELDILDAADPLTDDVDTIMDNASSPYDVSSQDMIIENSETVNEDMNLDEFAPVAQPIYSEGCILIYSYQQLLLIGSEEPVHVGDIVSEDIGTGDEVTDEEGNRVYYAKDGTYSLACDIPLDSEDFWQIPEDFEGRIAPLSNAEDKPLYASETDTIYIYNIKQLASLTIEDAGLYPVMSGDADVATFGSGQLIYPDSEEDEKSFLTYSKEHTYVLSVAFTTDLPVMRNMLRGPLRAVDDPLGGRDFEGQVLKEINGITYILIGNKEQLQHIGTGDEVYTRVYQAKKSGSNYVIETDTQDRPIILYGGDADLQETNGYGAFSYHDINTKSPFLADRYYAGVIQTGANAGQLGDGDLTQGVGKKSWKTGRYYTTDENYIIFRDIDLNNETWNPLMFTGTMYGARSENPGTTGSLWSCFQAAGADGKPNELNVVGGVRPTISNINVVPVTTNKSLTDTAQVLDVDEQKGVGFFGTIAAEYSRSSIMSSTAIVKSIRLEGGSINNTMSEGGVGPTLTSIALKTLGVFLNPVVEALLKRVTGKDSVEIPGGLGDLLDTRKDIPSYLATGAFAGRIMGNAIVEDCEVSDITVTTVQTVHEQNTASGRKIVGKGGFVGYVEGETRYDAISNALTTVTDSLEGLLNLIPGLGLGDLVTLLLENVLPLANLIPTGYYTPVIDRCVVDNGHLSNESGKYGVGGFAGSVSGAVIRDSKVKNSTMTVTADHFGGGFAGVARDAIINGTLSGLSIEVSSALHPQTELIKCSIEKSTMTVEGGVYLGGFTGVLANSYAFNNTIDTDTVTTVTGTGNYVGGFTGSAELGTLLGLGDYLARDSGALGTLTGLVSDLLGDENSNDKALLDLGGVAPAAIMGCQIDGRLTVSSGGSYVGGIVGRGEGTYITCSSPANIRKLAPYARQRDGAYVRELPIQDSEKRANRVSKLVSVTAGGDYAGGIAGYLTTASAGGVLGNTLGLADYIPFHLWLTTVRGVDGGYTVKATGNYAGGGIGWAVGGDIKDIELIDLKSVEANNRAGGFVGATGPGDLVNGGGIDLKLLGISLVKVENLLSLAQGERTIYSRANVTGIASGFTVKETGSDGGATIYSAGGYVAEANSVKMKECHVENLGSVIAVDDNGVAGGFVGLSSAGGLAGIAQDTNAPTGIAKLKNFSLAEVGQLVQAIPYLVPYYDGCTVSYVNGGFVQADTAGGFAGDFQSGKVNTETLGPDSSTSVEYEGASENCMEQPFSYENGLPGQPYSVFNIHHVRGGHYAGGWGGKVYSGALVSSGGGLSILGGSTGAVLNVDQLLGVASVYVPVIKYAGVNSYHEDTNEGFSVYAHAEETIDDEQTARGYAGGFIGYGSGIQVSYSDVHRLKTGDVEEPDPLEGQDGSSYMTFTNTPNDIPYAVAGARYAGGYIGHMDVGSAASVGDSLKLLGNNVDLTNLLSAFSVVVSTIEHSHVYGAHGGFSVIASGEIDDAKGSYDTAGIAYAGGYAGKISGGHIQDSNVDNFYYIVGEIAAGGYVGELVPGDVANILDDSSNVNILKGLLGTDILNTDNFASLVQDFVPTIRNSETTSVPCGGVVRAQCFSTQDALRGMAGGYVGHSAGGQIWGYSDDTWKSENDGYSDKLEQYIYLLNSDPPELDRKVGHYIGAKRECAAIRIRSVYGAEYAGGYCGLMECASTAQTGGLDLLGGLISTDNLLGALQAVYPVIRSAAVYGPLEKLDVETWNNWVRYVGSKGGFAPELYALGELPEGTDMNTVLSRFIYGYHVVAGRDTYDYQTNTILSGCAGGFVGSMHSGVIRDSSALDTKLVSAMRAAGGFAGEMQTKGLAELGSVSLLGIDLQLGNLLQAGSVFVPVITGSGTTGYQKGLTVQAHGDSTKAGVGCAGGYAGGVYGGQIGNKQSNGGTYPDVWVDGLRTVYGTNAIGGFAGKIAAASVLDVDTEEVNEDYLDSLLSYVTTSPGNLITLAQATYSTVKNARVSAADPEWGFVVDGEYNNGGKKYADYAGGFVGHVEAAVIGERDNATDKAVVNGLRGVIGGYYAGGFFGYGTTGSVAEVGGNNSAGAKTKLLRLIQLGNVSVLDAFRTYIYHSEVHGVEDGIRIYANKYSSTGRANTYRLSGSAGGFGGCLMNGTVEHSTAENLNYIEAPNYAAGMIAYMGKGGGIEANEVTIEEDDPEVISIDDILRVLGLDLGATAQLLNIVGCTVEDCHAKGFSDGFIVKTLESQTAVTDVVNEQQLIGSCAAGFNGFGDVAQIEQCTVKSFRYATSPQIAAGFIGRTSVAYIGEIQDSTPLLNLLLNVVDLLVRALYLDNLENAGLLNVGNNLLGLKILSDGELLYVNLFGLKISASLSKGTGPNGTDVALITLGSTTISLPCTNNGIDKSKPNIVVNLIQANRTAVKRSNVTGVDYGYDVFGSGTDQEQEEAPDVYWGYAGGFVGYNNVGHFSYDDMYLCDTVKGAADKTGPFVGGWKTDNNYDADRLEENNNYYRIYRGKDESLNQITTSKSAVIPLDGYDEAAGGPYNRYKVKHRVDVVIYSELEDANETGSGSRPLKAYVTSAHADLMLNTPLTPNGESEAIEPDDLKDPCAETFDLHIHKKWRDYGNLLGSRPASIQVKVLAIDVGTEPRQHLIERGFPDVGGNDETIVNNTVTGMGDLSGNVDNTITISGNREPDGTIHWSRVIEDLPVAFKVGDRVHYIQYVITEVQVENYKVPQYEFIEETASVIITNELDGIILPGTGAEGIYRLLMLGIALFTLGAALFLRRYRQLRHGAV